MNYLAAHKAFVFLLIISLSICTNAKSADDYARDVLPIITSHCANCHGPNEQEGDIRLDTLSVDVVTDRRAAEIWNEVLKVLKAGEMPPKEETALTEKQRKTLIAFATGKVAEAINALSHTEGRAIMRRLNRVEYQHTMRDLIGLDMDYVRDLPPDAISSDGFTNDGRFLQMSAVQLEYYLESARRALDRAIVVGPAPKIFDYEFTESKIDGWLGNAQRSNRLGRQQEFLAKMKDEYPEGGNFVVRVKLSASLKPDVGYPLLEVSVGYRPDTQILLREFDLVEITSADEQTIEFHGRIEEFPLPVRGQGKYPGLVVRVRNAYDDGSPRPKEQKDEKKKSFYADEPHLPTLDLKSVEFHGPLFDQWPPQVHRQILFDSPLREQDEAAYAREVLKKFMTRAFRRPVEAAELNRLHEHYQLIRPEFPSFEETMRETLAMVLVQPAFLYLIEPAGDEKRVITNWELASRLSYFLWSTMPDERLLELSAKGELSDSTVMATEVERMLSDPRASRFTRQFTDHWLHLKDVQSIAVNKEYYPKFDDSLKQDMRAETQQYFAELVRKNMSAINLLSSEFTMLNEPLAKHYGIENIYGQKFRRVKLNKDSHRGGLLGHAGILMINSTGSDSHAVRRAVWIRDRLLNDPPAPPPPDVPSLEEADPKFHQLSIREQLEIHREKESCASCHRSIDAWGIALENFDAVGLWRDEIRRKKGNKFEAIPVQATGSLPGGIELKGIDDLTNHLLTNQKEKFAASLVTRLLTYALGRQVDLSDQQAVDELTRKFATDDYRLRNLVISVVQSPVFQTK